MGPAAGAIPIVIIVAILSSLVVVAMILALPIYAILTFHRRKMEEIKLRRKSDIDTTTREAIEALRREIAALRDTTTQYDVSFDSAMSRMENRVAHLERQMRQVERTPDAAQAGRV